MKRLLLVILLPTIFNSYGQNISEYTILRNEYVFAYYEALGAFEICKKVDDTRICRKYYSKELDDYSFKEFFRLKTKEYLQNETFNILGSELTYNQFNEDDFDIDTSKLEIELTGNSDVIGNYKIDLIKSVEILDYLKLKKQDENNSLIEDEKNRLNLSSINQIKYKDNDDFEKDVKAEIINIINQNKKEILTSIKNSFSKYNDYIADFYNNKVSKREEYFFLTSEDLIDNTTRQKESFSFDLLIYKDQFFLRFHKTGHVEEPEISGGYPKSISEEQFKISFLRNNSKFSETTNYNNAILSKIFVLIQGYQEKENFKETKKQFEKDFDNIVNELENQEKTYGGIMVLNERIPLYITYRYKEKKPRTYIGKILHSSDEAESTILKDSIYDYFVTKKATINFFNNRADRVTISGSLENDKTQKSYDLTNYSYSLPLKKFRTRTQTNRFITNNNLSLKYYYNDVLTYTPEERDSHAIRNGDVKLKPRDSTKIYQRGIGDYFTGVFFTDFLGLNSNNPNGLIVAEGRLRIPLNLSTIQKCTFFDNISAYVGVSLFNGFDDNSRRIELSDIVRENPEEFDEKTSEEFITNNFELLRNNNVDAGIQLSAFTYEFKSAYSFLHFKYGVRFLRTSVEYDLFRGRRAVDEQGNELDELLKDSLFDTRNFQVFSIGQEAEAQLELRPQSYFGMDLTLGLNWIRETGTSKNDVLFSTINNTPNLKLMANVYSLLAKNSTNGVFFRIGGNYNLGSYSFFPRIMVGYATNLTSFVNRVKSK